MRALSRASKMEDAETMRICSKVTGVGIITINSGALSAFRNAGLTVNLQAINRAMHEIHKVMSEPQTEDLKFEDSDSGHNDGRGTLSEVEAISEKKLSWKKLNKSTPKKRKRKEGAVQLHSKEAPLLRKEEVIARNITAQHV
ncbi:unnamed protein product [Nippostrongylus brasiliensis]|uniref:TMV resistance protein N-like n=1 Tax=Nippostrongylus brasiliensis TaxID=27835 RepID=A0A0N4Y5B1_NIPBR|nr:unnamed protein product [Nippostrongylus brasiliensis]